MTIEGEKDMIAMKKLMLVGAAMSLAVGCISEDMTEGDQQGGDAEVVDTAGGDSEHGLDRVPFLGGKLGEKAPGEGVLAPGITYFHVYAVGSSNVGWEFTTASQLATVADHGGAQLRVAVLQYGYGVANGSLAGTSGTRYLTENLCGSFSNLHYCNAGETITGFLYYFSFDGMQGGTFSAYSNSLGVPWGVATDAINVL